MNIKEYMWGDDDTPYVMFMNFIGRGCDWCGSIRVLVWAVLASMGWAFGWTGFGVSLILMIVTYVVISRKAKKASKPMKAPDWLEKVLKL